MKRSQLLREAVDQYLSSSSIDYQPLTPFICNAYAWHVRQLLGSASGEADLMKDIVGAFMGDTGSKSTTAFGAALHCWPGAEFDRVFPDSIDLQIFRFMFAEFIALYLEDSDFDNIETPLPTGFTNAN